MSERIIIGSPRIGLPILIGSPDSQYPASQFGMEIERVGYEAIRTAFPDRPEEDIRYVFDPDNTEKIRKQIRAIEHLGKAGVCWAVPEVIDIDTEVTIPGQDDEAETEITVEREEKITGLLGFGLLKSNKSNIRLVNYVAERVLRMPAVAEVAIIHVRPNAREQGIGSMLLRRLGASAHDNKLMSKPAFSVIDGYASAKKFFEFYGLQRSEAVPPQIIADYFGPGKSVTAHTYEAPNWEHVLVNIHEREKLPPIEALKRKKTAKKDA